MIGGPMLCVGVSTCFRGLKSFCFTLYGLFRFSYCDIMPESSSDACIARDAKLLVVLHLQPNRHCSVVF